MPRMSRTIAALGLALGVGVAWGVGLASGVAAPAPAPGQPAPASLPTRSACDLIAGAAARYGLPLEFFTRLIWRESRFRLDALSPAGAQGVAQFMPGTAAERGLADPFKTPDALDQSAAFLSELRAAFGNLGLAAAGYNAGPGRVTRWLGGQAELPQETLDYVLAITGHDAAEWKDGKPSLVATKDFSCARYAALAAKAPAVAAAPGAGGAGPRKDWAVILVGNPRRDKVMEEYATVRGRFSKVLGGVQPTVVHRRISGLEIARYIVQIEQDTRAGANALCGRLLRAGGACFVLANR